MGIKVKKGDSILAAMQEHIPHWIHDTKKDAHSVRGFLYLPGCTCSKCGGHVNMEKEICPYCKSRMSSMHGVY